MRTFIGGLSALLFLIGMGLVAHAQDITSPSYEVLAPVVTSGGGYATSTDYSVLGVIGEFAHNLSSSASFNLIPGFAAYPFVSTPIISATPGDTTTNISWTAAVGVLGYSVSGYSVGQSTTSGGPYAFTSVGNVLAYSASGLTDGTTYYFIVRASDPSSIVIATSSEVSATPASSNNNNNNNGGSSGGGGPSGGGPPPSNTGVNFSGRAYPNSTITLLQDAQVVASTVADANAMFQISLTGVSGGNYIYSVYSEDAAGNRSSLLSFPVSVTTGATTNITGIFISPTIDVSDSVVKQGDNIAIFGQSAPKSTITITVNSSAELFLEASSDPSGAYLYNLDTSQLEIGSHLAKSKAAVAGQISDFGQSVAFAVGTQTVAKKPGGSCGPIGDLNCDGHVNLIDFSIMAYWYQRTPLTGTGLKADLNKDGKVNLTDFSILASHWTG